MRNRAPHEELVHRANSTGLSKMDLAEELGLDFERIKELTDGSGRATPEEAKKIEQLFYMTPGTWLKFDQQYEAWLTRKAQKALKDAAKKAR